MVALKIGLVRKQSSLLRVFYLIDSSLILLIASSLQIVVYYNWVSRDEKRECESKNTCFLNSLKSGSKSDQTRLGVCRRERETLCCNTVPSLSLSHNQRTGNRSSLVVPLGAMTRVDSKG